MTMQTESRRTDTGVAATNDTHGSGSMGSRPSQALFLGGLGVALMVLMLAVTAFVILSAVTYG